MELNRKPKIEDLPTDIVFDIICRLSIKEIIRFRSVCQSWDKLTKDNRFVDFHLNKALSDSKQTVILTPNTIWEDEEYPVFSMDVEKDTFCKWEEVPMMIKRTSQMSVLKVFASCNGLLCLATINYRSPIYIYNPMTRECMKLPDRYPITLRSNISFGLGFDPISKKYKVVCAYEGMCDITTVGENSWRRLEFPVKTRHSDMEMLFVDGAMHWLINEDKPSAEAVILALDINDEKIYAIKPPRCNKRSYLINKGNSLGLVIPGDNGLSHLWSTTCSRTSNDGRCYQYICEDVPNKPVLKYGYTLFGVDDPDALHFLYEYKLFGQLRSGSFIYRPIGEEHFLALYNPQKSETVKSTRVPHKTAQAKAIGALFCDAHFFVPTLVSPHCI